MPGPPPPVSASLWQGCGPHMCGPYNLPGETVFPGCSVGAAYMPPALFTTTQTQKKLLQRLKTPQELFLYAHFFLFSQNTLNFPYPLGLSSSNSSVLT